MKDGERFVCLIARDREYLNKHYRGNQDHHNFRDCDIQTFEKSAMYLAEKGYWVFRMGKAVHKPMYVDNSQFLDYANSPYRSDFLDIWLMANAFFVLSTGTGLDAVSTIFRRPHVFVNYDILYKIVSWIPSLTVPKHLYWKSNGKHLTFCEYMNPDLITTDSFIDSGIEIKDLTSNEILDAVKEFELNLTGKSVKNTEEMESI